MVEILTVYFGYSLSKFAKGRKEVKWRKCCFLRSPRYHGRDGKE